MSSDDSNILRACKMLYQSNYKVDDLIRFWRAYGEWRPCPQREKTYTPWW